MKNKAAYLETLRQGLSSAETREPPQPLRRRGAGSAWGTRPPRSGDGVRGVTASVSVLQPSTGAAPLRGTESPHVPIWAGEKENKTSFEAKILRILGGNRKL